MKAYRNVKLFGVPTGTDINQFSQYDYTKMLFTPKEEIAHKIIDLDSNLNIKLQFPQQPRWEHDYEFSIGKVEVNKDGTKMYNHNNSLIHDRNDTSGVNNFKMDSVMIAYFGRNTLFDSTAQTLSTIYTNMGFNVVVTDSNVLHALSDSLEYLIDFNKLIFEMRIFEDTLLQLSDWKQFQIVNQICIPKVDVLTKYENLSTGDRLQVSEIINYEKYTLLNEVGDTLVHFISDTHGKSNSNNDDISLTEYSEAQKKELDLIIFPNPAKNSLNVQIPFCASEFTTLEILDISGNKMHTDNHVKSLSKVKLDISKFGSGIYFVRVSRDGYWLTKKLVKQ